MTLDKTRNRPQEIAVYGKGGIGKSTVSANLSAALAASGRRVLQIGCDPKHDSTRLLMHGELIPTVLEHLRQAGAAEARPEAVLRTGAFGIGCIEAGGPKPGVGCAGRGIISAFEFLDRHHVKEQYDEVIYDVLGDVVCGGFAVPVRREYADAIFLVTSGEYMAIYAANNILRGILNFDGTVHRRVAGIVLNRRNLPDEEGRVRRFARAVGLPIVASVPRSEGFAEAEEQRRCLMELPGWEAEKAVFTALAEKIAGELTLFPALPLEDEALEAVVLGTERKAPEAPSEEKTAEAPPPAPFRRSPEDLPSRPGPERPPLYGCAFNGAATAAVHLTDALVIAHSPRACAFYTWQNISSPGRKNLFNRGILMPSAISPHFECSDMGHAEAVFGGMDKLREQVKAAVERKPGAVVVISSCVSGIIGDDIRSLESLSTPETPVIPIPADGDISGDYMDGIRDCLHLLAERLVDENAAPENDCLNLVGEVAISNNNEVNVRVLRRLLEQMGLRLNCRFLGDATCGELRGLLKAPLNILCSESADNLALRDWLTERFGCRFLSRPLPVGFEETASWLTEIGEAYGKQAETARLIEQEREAYLREVEALKPVLSGKTIVLTAINENLDWILRAAADVGMRFLWIGVMNYLRTPLNVSRDPAMLAITEEVTGAGQVLEKLRELRPDLLLSNYASAVAEEGNYLRDAAPTAPISLFGAALPVLRRWEAMFLEREETGGEGPEKGGSWKHDGVLFQKYFA